MKRVWVSKTEDESQILKRQEACGAGGEGHPPGKPAAYNVEPLIPVNITTVAILTLAASDGGRGFSMRLWSYLSLTHDLPIVG